MDPRDNEEFARLCRTLVLGFENADRSIPWLERETYKLIGPHLDKDGGMIFSGRLAQLSQTGPAGADNPFRDALRVIFAGASVKLSAQQRARSAKRLQFAFSHFVPPEFLIGFLHEFRNFVASADPNHFRIVPQMRGWVVRHQAAGVFDDNMRYKLPQDIIEEASALALRSDAHDDSWDSIGGNSADDDNEF